MKVEVFSAGDHFHADPKGAEELIETLLEKSGYTKDITWKVRIDKMLHCSPDSPPIRITGFKEFGVYMRVKPLPNSTVSHQMTLLIPDESGYNASNLFNQLKGCQKSISRQWREDYRKMKEKQTKPSIPVAIRPDPIPITPPPIIERTPVIETIVEEKPEFKDLKGISKNRQKLVFTLKKINAITGTSSKDEFIQRLQADCGWEDNLPRVVVKVMTALIKMGFICAVTNERGKIISYALAPRGATILAGNPDPGVATKPIKEEAPVVKKVVPPPDLGVLLMDFMSKAQEIADIGRKLSAIEDKRKALRVELEGLDKEYARLSATISHKNIWPHLKELNSSYVETPIKEA